MPFLRDPSLSPTSPVRKHAESLNKKFSINFENIQAQISSDRSLIMKTVYERHASGKGKARINWSAYGAARFRFKEDAVQDDSEEWKTMALLFEAESQDASITHFLESKKFSYETFRRIARKAIENGYISENIFSSRDQRIKRSANKHLLSGAIIKTVTFLESIKTRKISLSRDDTFADATEVEKYLEQFDLAPGINPSGSQSTGNPTEDSDADNDKEFTEPGNESSPDSDGGNNESDGETSNNGSTEDSGDPADSGGSTAGQGYGVTRSDKIESKLGELDSKKLIHLYHSLCVVSKKHATLLHLGAWAFFECLGRLVLPNTQDSRSTIGNVIKDDFQGNKSLSKDLRNRLGYVYEFGDCTKHSGTSFPACRAEQLDNDMLTLEPLILALIDRAIASKK